MEESEIAPLCSQKRNQKGENKKSVRKKWVFFFLFVSVAAACLYLMQAWKMVVIVDGEVKRQFFTFSKTVGELLEETGLHVHIYDKIVPGKDEKLGNGSLIIIQRALPVTLIVDGKAQQKWTQALTVAGLLQETGLCLGCEDTVFPDLNENLAPQQAIKVVRVSRKREIEREPVHFNTIRVSNSQMDYGLVRVAGEGSAGIKENIVETVRQGGEEISREVISSRVIKEPVPRVLEYGVNNSFSRSGRTYEFTKALEVNATAYCPGTPGSGCPVNAQGASLCTGFNNDGYTSTGIKAVAGEGTFTNPHIIAVDPQVIPLKTLVFIEGYGFARAEDTGSAIKGSSIDLLFDLHHDAYMFGRKTLKVYILRE